MRRLAVALMALGLSTAARAASPRDLDGLIKASCVRCHNEDNSLDLRVLPARESTDVWLKMIEMVRDNKMPPTPRTGSIEQRFPLRPEDRATLLNLMSEIVGSKEPLPLKHVSPWTWMSIVRGIAADVVRKEDFAAFDVAMSPVHANNFRALDQISMDNASAQLCATMAKRDLERAPTERILLKHLPKTATRKVSVRVAGPLVADLFRAVYEQEPSAEDLAAGAKTLALFGGPGITYDAAWVGLCTTYLAGPRLMFMYYARSR